MMNNASVLYCAPKKIICSLQCSIRKDPCECDVVCLAVERLSLKYFVDRVIMNYCVNVAGGK